MKAKITALSILVLVTSLSVTAQLSFGVRGGISSSEVKLKDFEGGNYDIDYAKGDPGFHIGGIAQVKILNLVIQPELLFTMARNDIKVRVLENVNDVREVLGSQNFYKMDIPLIAGYKIGPLKLQAGPVATFKLGSKSKQFDDLDIEAEFKGATFGYQAGIGIELANLLLDVKYEGNLSKFGDGVNIGGTSYAFDQRISQWILSVGFLIGN